MLLFTTMSAMSMPLIQLWNRMIVKTAKSEDLEVLEEMSDLFQVAISEKRHQIQQDKAWKEAAKKERRTKLQEHMRGTRSNLESSSAPTEMSFAVVSDPSEQVSRKSHSKKNKDMVLSNQMMLQDITTAQPDLNQLCYCGHQVVTYTCRKMGLNFGRRFLRCPQKPGSVSQRQFFQWIEPTKAESHAKMFSPCQDHGYPSKSHHEEKDHRHHRAHQRRSKRDSSSSSEVFSMSPKASRRRSQARGSQESHSPGNSCPHSWNRRGTNPHQEMKTCKLCGERVVHVYKTGEIIRSHVDPSSIK
jgi:hypothetical protein